MLILMTGLPGAQVRFEAEVCGEEVNALTNCNYRRRRRMGGVEKEEEDRQKSLNEFCVFQQVSAFRGNLPVSLASRPPPQGIPRKCPHFSVFKGTPLSVCVCVRACVCVWAHSTPGAGRGHRQSQERASCVFLSHSSIVIKKSYDFSVIK